jgi:hypothetical protein
MIRKSAVTLLVLVSLSSLLLWMLPRKDAIMWPVYRNRQRAPEKVGDWSIEVTCYSRVLALSYSRILSYTQAGLVNNEYGPWAGFYYRGVAVPFNHREGLFSVQTWRLPFWSVALLSLLYPTVTFLCGPYRRHRRRKKGLCLQCGYSLKGNVSGVCPECGEQI